MHRKALILICILAAILIATSCNTLPEETPQDFAFTFSYWVGARNVLDTFNGTYTKDMMMDKPVTIEFKLSKKQLEVVYKKMLEIDFFSYPEEFNPTTNFYDEPHSSYRFTVRA
ncbi:MAG TPA: hypothetical protein VE439_10905, partial [Anaerolineae bacterium]|nr:hypothetical protein [Anaerolineae bacterium]